MEQQPKNVYLLQLDASIHKDPNLPEIFYKNLNPGRTHGLSVSVVTYNVNGQTPETSTFKNLYNRFKDSDLIIICLQEVVEMNFFSLIENMIHNPEIDQWKQHLITLFKRQYCHVLFYGAVAMFVLPKIKNNFKVIQEYQVNLSYFIRNKTAVGLEVTYCNERIHLVTCHLPAHASFDAWCQRLDALKHIYKKMIDLFTTNFPIIFTGDFNFRRYEGQTMDGLEKACSAGFFPEFKEYARRPSVKRPNTYKYDTETHNLITDAKRGSPCGTDAILTRCKWMLKYTEYIKLDNEFCLKSDHNPLCQCMYIQN